MCREKLKTRHWCFTLDKCVSAPSQVAETVDWESIQKRLW